MYRFCKRLSLFAFVVAIACSIGCEPAEPQVAGLDQQGESSGEPLRIVSFAPAITGMVVDMGLGDQLVGVAEHDNAAPEGKPIVGSIFDLNTEKLLVMNPTHVLVMSTATGVPASLVDLAEEGRFKLAAYPYPNRIVEVQAALGCAPADVQDERVDIGTVLGMPERSKAVCERMTTHLNAITEATANSEPKRVLMFFGTEPLMASGPGTVLDDVLTNVVNAENAAGDSGLTAPVYDREKLLVAKPDVILLLMPGAPALKDMADDPRLAGLRDLPIPAVANNRVILLNDPLVLLPDSGLDRLAASMAKAVYPDLSPSIDSLMSDPQND